MSELNTKLCNKCLQTKPLDVFRKKVGGRLGREAVCAQCRADWYKNDYCQRPEALAATRGRVKRVQTKNKTANTQLGVTVTEKQCTLCREVKPAVEFSRASNIRDGLHTRCKDCNNKQSRDADMALRKEVLLHYGGQCVCPHCDVVALNFLTIDHVYGGGSQHVKTIGSRNLYFWLKKMGFPSEGFRVLCYNCNLALGHRGYCHDIPDHLKEYNKTERST